MNFRAPRKGQALVELALIATVLALLLLGIVEVVSMYNAKSYVIDAARAGVRQTVLSYDDFTIASTAMNILIDHGMNTVTAGTCDIHEIEIYQSLADGSLDTSSPNNEDILYPRVSGSQCVLPSTPDYAGFPQSERQAVQAPGTDVCPNPAPAPPNAQCPLLVGVRITYTYHMKTPIFAAYGPTMTMRPYAVMALGGDNPGNYQAFPSSTPVNTFTPTNTPTFTPTATSTPTKTYTPSATGSPTSTSTNSATPAFTYTPTLTVCQRRQNCPATSTPTQTGTPTKTSTPTRTATVTSTPTITATPTSTPIPSPVASLRVFCDTLGTEFPPGIRITLTGGVPGATQYNIYYFANPQGQQIPVGAITPASPGGTGFFPTAPPYYLPISTPGFFTVAAVSGGVEGTPASLPVGPAISANTSCSPPES